MTTTARPWWQRPQLRTDDDRSVGWLELFFDLVFVVVIARLAHELAGSPDARGVIDFGVQFFAVFWVWNAFTYYTERFEAGGIEDRALTFLAILPVAALAVFADGGLAEHYPAFAVAYLGARAVNMIAWTRAAFHVPAFRPITVRFVIGYCIVTASVVASLALGPDGRLALFAAAIAVDVATPFFTVRQQATLPPISTSKFPERFGLFTIIVLGESIVGVINGVSDLSDQGTLSASVLIAATLGLGIGFGLWWIYFDFVARRPPKPAFGVALGWVYLHLAATTAITVTGVGISAAVADAASGALRPASQHLLSSGVGLALLIIAALETTLDRPADDPNDPRISPAGKALTGVAVLVIGWMPVVWPTAALLAALLSLLCAHAAHGAVVWFTRGPGAKRPT